MSHKTPHTQPLPKSQAEPRPPTPPQPQPVTLHDPDKSGIGSDDDKRSVSTVADLPAPAGTNDACTAPTVTGSCSAANTQTQKNGRQLGPKPKPPDSSQNEPFRFPIGKTKQEKTKQPKPDRSTPRPCPQCNQLFTPRATGRIPTYCSSYCRVQAFKERKKQA